MAGIDVVASIVGVAGAGFRLSLYLSAISCEVVNAPIEIHHISKTVTLFSSMLNQIGSVLKASNSIHSSEAVETAQQMASDSQQVFGEIHEMVERCKTSRPDGTFTPSIQQRFKWCFKKNRVQYLLGQLESLKLSLSLMLQIIQLGKLMASTSKTDPPEVVQVKKDEISRERLDVQNIVIVMHMQNEHVDGLFKMCEQDEPESSFALSESPSSTHTLLAIEPPDYRSSVSLVRLPLRSLGELDHLLQGMQSSPRDMIQVSERVIDPLLERWTVWRQVREARHAQQANSRYVPHVDSLYEDDEDVPLHERYPSRDGSPHGYYLEGTTTNWREPHSVAARQELAHKKKQYSGYQPSVSAVSSDLEHSPGSNTSRRRQPRHIITSSSDSSDTDSEYEKDHKRKDSGFAGHDKPRPENTTDRSLPRNTQSTQPNSRMTPLPNSGKAPVDSKSTLSPQCIPQSQHRPHPTPEQHNQQHSYTTPLPPIYTHHATQQFTPSPSSPNNIPPPYHGQYPPQVQRQQQGQYPPNRGYPHPRPISRDGVNGRSPSRLSHESSRSHRKPRERRNSREDKRLSRESTAKNLRNGAAQGLLSAGAIAGFLEALESLSL